MTVRLLVTALAVCLAPFAVHAADDHPYKNVKKGDTATYKMKIKVGGPAGAGGGSELDGTATQEVTAKTDKEATVKITANFGGTEAPTVDQTIKLDEPFDPTKAVPIPGGGEATVEKGKSGMEEIKIGDKKYATTWTSYKVKAKAMGTDLDMEVKVWMAKDAPMGMVKLEMAGLVAKLDTKITMELSSFTNKQK